MATVTRPAGFGTVPQVAAYFGISQEIVRQKARSGEWPSYMVAGKRVFSYEELLSELLVKAEPDVLREDISHA